MVENPKKEDTTKKIPKQGDKEQKIVDNIEKKYSDYKSKRVRTYPQFGISSTGGERTLVDAMDYGNKLVDNYKIKANWKEDWQANISDITLHSKLMAILANMTLQKFNVEYKPMFSTDRNSVFLGNVMDDYARWITTKERNGHLDQLFIALKALREPAAIRFIGYKKLPYFEGLDYQHVKLDEFYPERLDTFFMNDIHRCIWRKVWNYDAWKDSRENNSAFNNVDKVKRAGAVRSDGETFFDISVDVGEDQVEEKLWFDEVANEFHISANQILITRPGTKLTSISKGGKIPFAKSVFEPFGPNFFYGRPLAMIMGPNQEAIDFMFNAMFDKTMLDVMRPILVGGINDIVDDYIGPGIFTEVADVNQIKEMDVKPLDLTSFRVMQELQSRNAFASVDAAGQGKVSLGNPTATEIERVQEQQQKLFGLFNTMINDGLIQERDLMGYIIIDKYFKRPDMKQFFIENAKLMNGKVGTKVIRIKPKSKLPLRDELGVSPDLRAEAEKDFDGETQIIEFDPRIFDGYKFMTISTVAPAIENSKTLKKAMLDRKLVQFYNQPELFNPETVKKIDVENNKDILGEHASELLGNQQQQAPQGLPDVLGGGSPATGPNSSSPKALPDPSKLLGGEQI